MSDKEDHGSAAQGSNQWTVMFYFAGDNALAPLIVSQVKAIKDAGFQADTEVLVYFDPNENRVPTRIYNVNSVRKFNARPPKNNIGDGEDPYVRNMFEDYIHPNQLPQKPKAQALKEALEKPDAITASKALENFIEYCKENHPAKHYILFLVGHGMIVGNDAFLPDDNPDSAITLKELGGLLRNIPALELLALHSCSMSAIEVAYELEGCASYMLASQGISFVGSWPYRQVLKKIFGVVKKSNANTPAEIAELTNRIFDLCLHNATDFMLTGYSHDLCLSRLSPTTALTEAMRGLTAELKEGLLSAARDDDQRDERVKRLILLAHWESQSYWKEDYTDLFDFCFCLNRMCETEPALERLAEACRKVMAQLDALVVRSNHFGSKYQYSHGLSIYFPWSEPLGDLSKDIMGNYSKYRFNCELGNESWHAFLQSYFKITQRKTRDEEEGREKLVDSSLVPLIFDPLGALSDDPGKPTPAMNNDPNKPSPRIGADCTCASIKNYATEDVVIKGKPRKIRAFSISGEAFTEEFQ